MVSPAIVPVPLKENGHVSRPGIDPFPLMLIVTVLPLTCPVPVPLMFALPRQVAVNEPEISVSVWAPTVHTKFEHDPLVAEGPAAIVLDDQWPSSDGIAALGSRATSVVGAVLVLERFTSQPASATTAARRTPEKLRATFILVTPCKMDVRLEGWGSLERLLSAGTRWTLGVQPTVTMAVGKVQEKADDQPPAESNPGECR
jgi:hypothetical protein